MADTCATCTHHADDSTCRRYSPAARTDVRRRTAPAVWPTTADTDWCSEHEATPDPGPLNGLGL